MFSKLVKVGGATSTALAAAAAKSGLAIPTASLASLSRISTNGPLQKSLMRLASAGPQSLGLTSQPGKSHSFAVTARDLSTTAKEGTKTKSQSSTASEDVARTKSGGSEEPIRSEDTGKHHTLADHAKAREMHEAEGSGKGKDGNGKSGTDSKDSKGRRIGPTIFFAVFLAILGNGVYYVADKNARERAIQEIIRFDTNIDKTELDSLSETAVLTYDDLVKIYQRASQRFPDGLIPVDDLSAIVAEQVYECRASRQRIRDQLRAERLQTGDPALVPTLPGENAVAQTHASSVTVHEHGSKTMPRFPTTNTPSSSSSSSSSLSIEHTSTSLSPSSSSGSSGSSSKALVVASVAEGHGVPSTVPADSATPTGNPGYLEMSLDLLNKLLLTDDWIDNEDVDKKAFQSWLTNTLFAAPGYMEEVLANPNVDIRVIHYHLVNAFLGKPPPTPEQVEAYLRDHPFDMVNLPIHLRRTGYGATSEAELRSRKTNPDRRGVDGDEQQAAIRHMYSPEEQKKAHEKEIAKIKAFREGRHQLNSFGAFINPTSTPETMEGDMLKAIPRVRRDLVPLSHAMLALAVMIEDYDTPTPQSILDQEVYRPHLYKNLPTTAYSVHTKSILDFFTVPTIFSPEEDKTRIDPATGEVVQVRKSLSRILASRRRMNASLRRRLDFLPAHRLAMAWLCAAHMEDVGDIQELKEPPKPAKDLNLSEYIIPSKGFWPFNTNPRANEQPFAKSVTGEVFFGYYPRPEETKMDLRISRIFKAPDTLCEATDAARGADPRLCLSAKGLHKLVRMLRATGHIAPTAVLEKTSRFPVRYTAASDEEVTRRVLEEIMNGRLGDKAPQSFNFDLESTERTISFVDVESAFRRLSAREAPAYPWYYSLETTTELESSQQSRLRWLYGRKLNMRQAEVAGIVSREENRWVSEPIPWYEREFYALFFPTNWLAQTAANQDVAEKGIGMAARWRYLTGIDD